MGDRLILLMFNVIMGGFMIARRRGMFGTPDAPFYFDEGAAIPWWVSCRWPLDLDIRFAVDVETYFERGMQVVRPLHARYDSHRLRVRYGKDGWVHGAPTMWLSEPRKRPEGATRHVLASR